MKVLISGGFDCLHTGHLDLIEAAAGIGSVVVALNSDAWLMRKKGFVFMSFDDRHRIMTALHLVSFVTAVDDSDGTVCEAIRRIYPGAFLNGGDRTIANPKEGRLCHELGIEQVFHVGGRKTRSSSKLIRQVPR